MRALGTQRLEELRWEIYSYADSATATFLPPDIFLPDGVIKLLLDTFALLDTVATLRAKIGDRAFLLPHIWALWDVVCELEDTFRAMREESKRHQKARQAAKGMASGKPTDEAILNREGGDGDSEGDGIGIGDGVGVGDDSDGDDVQGLQDASQAPDIDPLRYAHQYFGAGQILAATLII